jgi:hypothetical protein
MAFKKMHTVVAVVGIVGASTLAWWLQSPKSDAGGPAGARPLGVEVGQVKKLALRDDAEAVEQVAVELQGAVGVHWGMA